MGGRGRVDWLMHRRAPGCTAHEVASGGNRGGHLGRGPASLASAASPTRETRCSSESLRSGSKRPRGQDGPLSGDLSPTPSHLPCLRPDRLRPGSSLGTQAPGTSTPVFSGIFRRKAVDRCGFPAEDRVCLFYSSAIYTSLQPTRSYSQRHGKRVSLFYHIVSPALHLLTCNLRNRE